MKFQQFKITFFFFFYFNQYQLLANINQERFIIIAIVFCIICINYLFFLQKYKDRLFLKR